MRLLDEKPGKRFQFKNLYRSKKQFVLEILPEIKYHLLSIIDKTYFNCSGLKYQLSNSDYVCKPLFGQEKEEKE